MVKDIIESLLWFTATFTATSLWLRIRALERRASADARWDVWARGMQSQAIENLCGRVATLEDDVRGAK